MLGTVARRPLRWVDVVLERRPNRGGRGYCSDPSSAFRLKCRSRRLAPLHQNLLSLTSPITHFTRHIIIMIVLPPQWALQVRLRLASEKRNRQRAMWICGSPINLLLGVGEFTGLQALFKRHAGSLHFHSNSLLRIAQAPSPESSAL
jgi:hypothetical protein